MNASQKCIAVLLFLLAFPCFAFTKIGRMGLGYSNQLINNVPAISVKLQKSRTTAIGGMCGIKTNSEGSDYGVGVKMYRLLFEEPNLNFYMANLIAILKQDVNNTSKSGYQVDFNLGSEFHIPGIESVGFSFEFGLSVNKLQSSTTIQTNNQNFVVAGVHFYL